MSRYLAGWDSTRLNVPWKVKVTLGMELMGVGGVEALGVGVAVGKVL
jgi:hypothetical protein